MRFLLALMAMTLFAVSVGCDKPSDSPDTPDTPAVTEGDGAAEGSGTKTEGSDTKAAEGDGASTEANSETQTVSLKLPGMT